MAHTVLSLAIPVSFCLAMAGSAAGQAVVESSLGAARATTTTAPAKGVGKSMSGLAGGLDNLLKAAPKDAAPQVSTVASAPPTKTPAPAQANREDPGAIEPGLGYDDLVKRFGQPFMTITDGGERSLSYRGKDGVFSVKVQDGTVKSIEKPQP